MFPEFLSRDAESTLPISAVYPLPMERATKLKKDKETDHGALYYVLENSLTVLQLSQQCEE